MRQFRPLKSKQIFATFLMLFCFSGAFAVPPTVQKMTPEEVIAKHLAAIGTSADLAAAKTRILGGEVLARLKLLNTLREVGGPGQFASDGNKVLLAMAFNANNYPFERAGFDGDKLTIATLPSGGRSQLASFFASQDILFRHGLVGGALSSAWALQNFDAKEAKLSYAGTEKINGREAHELKYQPRKGDLKVNLYFDAETFQHVRSLYEYSVSAQMGRRPGGVTGPATPTGGVSRFRLTEDFSDFKPEGKLTLPHTYKLHLVVDSLAQNLEYTVTFSQFVFDQPIPPDSFNVNTIKAN